MADGVAITAGTGTTILTDDTGAGGHAQVVKLAISTDGSGTLIPADANGLDVDVTRINGVAPAFGSGVRGATVQRVTIATDDVVPVSDNGGSLTVDGTVAISGTVAVTDNASTLSVDDGGGSLTVDGTLTVNPQGYFATCSTTFARPADTTAYSINDAISDNTATPTTGGFTFTGAARASGGSGIITDAIVTTDNDAGTLLQGEIWLFDQAVTNVNDNAAFAVSDTEIKTCVGKIPFTLEDAGNNGFYHAQNLNIGYTCSGSANLRFLVRAKNGYTPASGESLTFVIKCLQVT